MRRQLIMLARDLLRELGIVEQRSSYPAFLTNEELDRWQG